MIGFRMSGRRSAFAPAGLRLVVALAGVDPAFALGRRFLLPEGRFGLQPIHDEFARREGFAAVLRGDPAGGKRTGTHPRAAADAGGQLLGVLHCGRGCRVGGSCAVQCIRPCAPPAENEVKGVFA